MISELLLIAAVGIIDPMDMSGHQMYPSGVKEMDKYPKYAPPTSSMATLSVAKPILASDGRSIPAGHYLVSLSISRQELLLFEGKKTVYTLKVDELRIKEKPLKLATAKFYTNNNGECFIIVDDKKYQAVVRAELSQ